MNRPDPPSVPLASDAFKSGTITVRLPKILLGRFEDHCWSKRLKKGTVLAELVRRWCDEQEMVSESDSAEVELPELSPEEEARLDAEYEKAKAEGRPVW